MADKTNPPENEFAFTVRRPSPEQNPTYNEKEQCLLEKLSKGGDKATALWDLAKFYSGAGIITKALEYIRQASNQAADPESMAYCYLGIGIAHEKLDDYESARKVYMQAYAIEPVDPAVWYFINNNMGYCLNRLGKHEEAERLCRTAIKTDPARHNAHKNLGISCAGKGDYAEAAKCFITATRLEASDGRALKHLEKLIEQHGELTTQMPNLLSDLQACRRAVELANITRNSMNSKN